jgi:hypothetical protein
LQFLLHVGREEVYKIDEHGVNFGFAGIWLESVSVDKGKQHEHIEIPSSQGRLNCIVYIEPAHCQASIS